MTGRERSNFEAVLAREGSAETLLGLGDILVRAGRRRDCDEGPPRPTDATAGGAWFARVEPGLTRVGGALRPAWED